MSKEKSTVDELLKKYNICENCGATDGFKCKCDGKYPLASYRPYKGESIFQGIIIMDEHYTFKKLDDPNNMDLDNAPGHYMWDDEFFSESCHYDGSAIKIKSEIKDIELMDFVGKPDSFDDSKAQVDFKFPHGIPGSVPYTIPQVRAYDTVRVVASGTFGLGHLQAGVPYIESFWVTVHSVTIFGLVTGLSKNTLHHVQTPTRIHKGDYLSFPITCVLGVQHGPYWKQDKVCAICQVPKEQAPEGSLKSCSGCHRAHYCSVQCQKRGWKQHKQVCDGFILKQRKKQWGLN